jgi:hypothetical protein
LPVVVANDFAGGHQRFRNAEHRAPPRLRFERVRGVDLEVAPLADVAVSLYLPGEITLAFGITGPYARQTNYISPPGNFAEANVMPIGNLTDHGISSAALTFSPTPGPAGWSRSATR